MQFNSDVVSPPMPAARRRSSLRKSLCPVSVLPPVVASDLEQRLTKAQQEAEEWKQLMVDRRHQSKITEKALAQSIAEQPTLDFEAVKGDLTAEDLDFLSQRPDYAKQSESIDSFFEDLGMLNENISLLNRQIGCNEFLARSRLNQISHNICVYNETNPLWLHDNP